ncbi:MAG TPA: hypothetical protein ENK67_05630 [Flavobacteriia bacterium]|nr:hypothetical protein [Flavobacteriia bacterium]
MKNIVQILIKFKNLLPIFAIIVSLSSCSSYQNISSESDGIYDDSDAITKKEVANKEAIDSEKKETKNASRYENYFKSKAEKIKIENNEIFTDVDSYSSEDDEDLLNKDVTDFSTNNPTWDESGETVVNVFNYNNFRPFYSWYRPFYRPFFSGLYIDINPWWFSEFDYYYGYNFYSPFYTPYYYPFFYPNYYSYYQPSLFYQNYRYGRRNTSRNLSLNNRTARSNIRRSSSNYTRTNRYSNRRITNGTRTNNQPRTRNNSYSSNPVNTKTPRVKTRNSSSSNHYNTPRTRSYSTPSRRSSSNSNTGGRSIRRR